VIHSSQVETKETRTEKCKKALESCIGYLRAIVLVLVSAFQTTII